MDILTKLTDSQFGQLLQRLSLLAIVPAFGLIGLLIASLWNAQGASIDELSMKIDQLSKDAVAGQLQVTATLAVLQQRQATTEARQDGADRFQAAVDAGQNRDIEALGSRLDRLEMIITEPTPY